MKVALCFMTKDRVELSRQSFPRLLQAKDAGADIWWMDGSTTPEGEKLPDELRGANFVRMNVRGGPDAAVAYAVTECLGHDYTHIGIVENDVVLQTDWYSQILAAVARAESENWRVGAVSARCYEDRVLFQGDGYNIMHNLGFGMVLWTREAAQLMLKYMRTHWTLENRKLFQQLAEVDIGTYWAFRVHEGWICADWGVDRVLADHGLCSIALDPSPVEMIGQIPPLPEQGLVLATGRDLGLRHDTLENRIKFMEQLNYRWIGEMCPTSSPSVYHRGAGWINFVHQLGAFPVFERDDNWRLQWTMGYGPFGYRARDGQNAKMRVRVAGHCSVMVSGHTNGGPLLVRDLLTGYEVNPTLPGPHQGQAAILGVVVPGQIDSRIIEIEASPGVVVYGVMTEELQPRRNDFRFDHSVLPGV